MPDRLRLKSVSRQELVEVQFPDVHLDSPRGDQEEIVFLRRAVPVRTTRSSAPRRSTSDG